MEKLTTKNKVKAQKLNMLYPHTLSQHGDYLQLELFFSMCIEICKTSNQKK